MSKEVVSNSKELPISVVIATLGGEELKETINQLNLGEAIPAEILICIPEADAYRVDDIASMTNVHVIKTACRGQVAQRAIGLTEARHPYVMQFDDDVFLPKDTLRVLFEKLVEKGPRNIVAPFFRIRPSGIDGTREINGVRGFLRSCHATLVCGAPFGTARYGKISSAGVGFGVPKNRQADDVIESEWLPGGVVLSHKSDLITDNYFPFPGKAFSEDLIHSILWRRAGCRLWTVLDVSAMIDVTIESFAWESVKGRYNAHAYVAKLIQGSIWRTRIWLLCYCLKNLRQLIKQNSFFLQKSKRALKKH